MCQIALDLRRIPLPSPVSHAELSSVVASLYSRQLELSVHSVEPILRLAVALGMDCLKEACVGFVVARVVPVSPVEVRLPCSMWPEQQPRIAQGMARSLHASEMSQKLAEACDCVEQACMAGGTSQQPR